MSQINLITWSKTNQMNDIANQMLPMIIIDAVNQDRKFWQNVQPRLIYQKIKQE